MHISWSQLSLFQQKQRLRRLFCSLSWIRTPEKWKTWFYVPVIAEYEKRFLHYCGWVSWSWVVWLRACTLSNLQAWLPTQTRYFFLSGFDGLTVAVGFSLQTFDFGRLCVMVVTKSSIWTAIALVLHHLSSSAVSISRSVLVRFRPSGVHSLNLFSSWTLSMLPSLLAFSGRLQCITSRLVETITTAFRISKGPSERNW